MYNISKSYKELFKDNKMNKKEQNILETTRASILEKFERYDERIIKFLSMKIKKIPEEESGLTVTS